LLFRPAPASYPHGLHETHRLEHLPLPFPPHWSWIETASELDGPERLLSNRLGHTVRVCDKLCAVCDDAVSSFQPCVIAIAVCALFPVLVWCNTFKVLFCLLTVGRQNERRRLLDRLIAYINNSTADLTENVLRVLKLLMDAQTIAIAVVRLQS